MDVPILPLAITMMAGPQIISAIILVTGRRPISASLAFVGAVALMSSIGVWLALQLAGVISLPNESGAQNHTLEVILVGLLILGSIRTYLTRATAEPPKWLGAMQTATVARAFVVGFLLIALFPGDIVVMLTAGTHLHQSGLPWSAAVPFIGLTTLIAAAPLLAYLLFRKRAEAAMPSVRDWLNSHSWAVNILVYLVFIYLVLS